MRRYSDPAAIGLRVHSPDEVRGILAELRRGLEGIYGERLRGMLLFGSYARGDAEAGSDLDVLVLLDRIDSYWEETERVGDVAAALSLAHDLPISIVQLPEAEWQRCERPFVRNVRREGRAA